VHMPEAVPQTLGRDRIGDRAEDAVRIHGQVQSSRYRIDHHEELERTIHVLRLQTVDHQKLKGSVAKLAWPPGLFDAVGCKLNQSVDRSNREQ